MSPRVINYNQNSMAHKSQPEFMKFKDIKESLEYFGPKRESVPTLNKDNLSTSRSVGKLPLGVRMYNQATVYRDHKEKLKEHFDYQQYKKEV
jgi:hypothetical protein